MTRTCKPWLWLMALIAALSSDAASVTFEAESGTLGSDWAVSNSVSPVYITILTDFTGNCPSNAARVATCPVTFPAADTYQLYARVRVGPGGGTDDSLFYGNGFGTKNPTNNPDWILVNNLVGVGFTNATNVITGGGTAGTGVWKWINLSLYAPGPTFTVTNGNLTQTLQIGARENGLDIDKLVLGSASYTFTVSNLDNATDGTQPPPSTTTIDTTKTYQTVEGLGGATAFYAGWFKDHPYKQEVYSNAFAGLNLSMLRLGNWFRYTNGPDTAASDIVSNANRYLGHPVPVYMSSWAPPASLKSNGQVGNGGTLITNSDGTFAYTNFAQYWYDSIQAYQSNGVSLAWISIQNEPDWVADYDSCVFHPNEDTVNGTNYASYAKALNAVYQKLTNLPAPPKILGPEVVHIHYGDLPNYAATMNSNSFYGVNYHLYGGSTDGSADGYAGDFTTSTNVFPSKPHFMTEFGYSDMMQTACLIHDCFTLGQTVGFNYWSLIWPAGGNGLVQIENPYNMSSWTNAPPGVTTQSHGWWLSPSYWAMKHFSYFIQPGYKRVSAGDDDNNVRTSAFLSPDGLRLVVVAINTNATISSTMNFNFGTFNAGKTSVYQTAGTNTYAGTNTFLSLGALTNGLILPAQSITTVVADQFLTVGAASNPSPANSAAGVSLNSPLIWKPGSNALFHAVYFGVSSNAVAQATTASPQYLGTQSATNYFPPLLGGTNYFWRVDEIAGINTNTGAVWIFSTASPALQHEYPFSESGGTTTADAVGGPAWTGSLPNGGTFSGGQLTLTSGSSQYVSLPSGIVSGLTNFSIEVWVKLNSTANWNRIFDFGNNTTTYMFLTPQNGSTTRLRYAITTNSSGGEQQINGPSALAAGAWNHVVVTLNGSTGILYLNGAAVGTNNTMTLKPATLGITTNNYLGKSQWADPYLNGLLDEFRIYGVALSPMEIAATYALGPNQLLSTNSPRTAASVSGNNLTLSWPLVSAGFTLQSSTNLASGSWTAVSSPQPQIVGTNCQVMLLPTNAARYFRLVK